MGITFNYVMTCKKWQLSRVCNVNYNIKHKVDRLLPYMARNIGVELNLAVGKINCVANIATKNSKLLHLLKCAFE